MAYRSKYTGRYSGIGRLLQTPGVQAACMKAATEIMTAAVARAPVGGNDDPHPGQYKASFIVTPHEKNVPFRGKPKLRAGARVLNTAPHALHVEYGTARTPRHAVLSKAMDDVAGRFG
ncbi:hypothetical protein [Streptomyces sp. CBG33]|uniref:hypothetical protein n=1 Tax=Streptomyces sp. CBG33 TaxID=2762624 RepID=UPI0016449C22|nr:hypothetical protein [Streptomyces sp. CBG33]